MLKPLCHETNEQLGYLQALDDFSITELLAKLSNYCQEQEQESLAALLISQLTESIDAEVIANYLSAIAGGTAQSAINQKFSPASVDLPVDFPDTAKIPRFLYGDKLRWVGSDSDWGTVYGRFYSFAPQRCSWTWCYLIWLSQDSPSAAWTLADIAWEEDLEPLEMEPVL
ncbi:hypothetical protein [Scytonema sp. PCC 10023]|uniref:hypothetical protein n=1 Tax=Scytonema sp. PCC 10023 TaxID=1680591 RepID=UPI0039C6C133